MLCCVYTITTSGRDSHRVAIHDNSYSCIASHGKKYKSRQPSEEGALASCRSRAQVIIAYRNTLWLPVRIAMTFKNMKLCRELLTELYRTQTSVISDINKDTLFVMQRDNKLSRKIF